MRGFVSKEEGSLTILSLIFFMLMFMIGGLAVDMLVFENNRTRLQNVSDRATLAAANMNQDLDATEVVNSYFEKEGLKGYIDDVQVVDNGIAKSVRVVSNQDLKTMFMRMVGTTDLSAPANSMAAEAAGNVEISLVLDNSGSMGTVDGSDGKTRLDKLKEAVDTFLTVMYPEGEDPKTTVSVVPYSTQVNAGPELMNIVGTPTDHDYSHCIDFEDTDFNDLTIKADGTAGYTHVGHFDMFYDTDSPSYWKCRPEASQHVYVMGSDPSEIRDRVNALIANGQTSLHLGAKWGAALLDPSANPIVTSLISEPGSDVLPEHSNRPVAYSDGNTVKALILLTDGVNTVHNNLTPAFKSGNSDLYKQFGSLTEIVGSIQGLTENYTLIELENLGLDLTKQQPFYSLGLFGQNIENGDEDGDGITNEKWWTPDVYVDGVKVWDAQFTNGKIIGTGGSGGSASDGRMKWVEVWADMSPIYYSNTFIKGPRADQAAYDDFMANVFTSTQGATKDTHLDTLCTEARARGLTVYTIGLEVTDHSRNVLSACASTINFYLDASSDNLEAKFQEIADSIMDMKLRLVQ